MCSSGLIVKSVRNPYSLPDLSREGKWLVHGHEIVKDVCQEEERINSKIETHERLFAHQTLSTARRDCRYRSDKVPKDSLDFMLSSIYYHDKDLFVPKMYTAIQPESIDKETWRQLRNQIKVYSKPSVPLGHEIKYAEIESKRSLTSGKSSGLEASARKRIHPSSLQLAIEGPHTDRTNPGYSRKIDGTYYGI
ncbi:uncharacterized protein LOC106651180 [Trichogramma pretiosum]|uniref:Uncharacterized protein n=1 Tax=Trichogramma kaykai TaxID=54128 RepID=A0ABD2WRY7_9HYME|nr:uncharacterized protein LOC106651180 [Trichogramma pretiosum]XP_014225066.1 uncharacterized protein LOC106651180 [Trichogramma pretiosum]